MCFNRGVTNDAGGGIRCYDCDAEARAHLCSPVPAPLDAAKIRALVARQADDEGLWFEAITAPEAYLQQELRKLHAAIEGG